MSDLQSATDKGTGTHRSRRGRELARIGLEIVLIGVGVFLGLAGQQWRENAQHHQLGTETLRRFRSEIEANRTAVAGVKDYHAATRERVRAYLAATPDLRQSINVEMHGIQPVQFEHTAWDLALATQALTYMDPKLAFAVARVYNAQQMYTELTGGMLQAMYLRPPGENRTAFLRIVGLYYDDVVVAEPKLLGMYDTLLRQIDSTLGTPVAGKASSP